MNAYWITDQILQHSLNAMLGFLILAALTTGVIKLFNIHSPRLRASLRMIPPLRLLVEPLFWIFPLNFAPVNLSLFSCSHPIQIYFYCQLSEASRAELNQYGLKSTVGKALLLIPEQLLWTLIAAFVLTIAVRLTLLITGFMQSIFKVRKLTTKGTRLPIEHSTLKELLHKHSISVFVSKETSVPFAGWGKTIVLPADLVENYSKEELETVLAHESEHIIRKDLSTRLLSKLVSAIFWWIPLKQWAKLIDYEQEMACDAAIHNYALDKIYLATALQKCAHNNASESFWLTAAFSSKSHQLVRRMQAILTSDAQLSQNRLSIIAAAIVLIALIPIITFIVC